jgi:Ser/Thr protein kinase RdoA (MazF antagonist)
VGDVYRVKPHRRTRYLKIYLPLWRPKSDIEAEVEFLNYLIQARVPVGKPVARRDGSFLTRIDAPEGTRWAVLFEGARGGDLDDENEEHSRAFGRAVASMHNSADKLTDGFRAPSFGLEYLVDDQLAVVEPFMSHRRRDFRFIRKIGEETKALIEARLARSKPQWGLCHGDLHSGDARIDGKGCVTLFDFSSFGRGWRPVDIGVFPASHDWMDTSRKTRTARRRQWRAFLDGYRRERPLTPADIEAAELSIAVRHIYLMGVPLVCWSAMHGHHWVTDEYFDWHMKWFKAWQDSPKIGWLV